MAARIRDERVRAAPCRRRLPRDARVNPGVRVRAVVESHHTASLLSRVRRAPWRTEGGPIGGIADIVRGRVVVVGIGNALRADDAAGPMLAEALRCRFPDRVFDVGEVPENYLGPIRRARPDTILLVDAADFGGVPGEVRVVSGDEVGGLALGTHAPPLSVFMEVAAADTGASVRLVAVQVTSTELGRTMSQDVRATVERLASELADVLGRPSGDAP
jgi:hydrogenase 3 maturation protease